MHRYTAARLTAYTISAVICAMECTADPFLRKEGLVSRGIPKICFLNIRVFAKRIEKVRRVGTNFSLFHRSPNYARKGLLL